MKRLVQVLTTCRALPMVLLVGCVTSAHAAGPTLFQHGGRATAQVGAFTAREGDAGLLTYNPASIARLDDANFQIGFDFTAPRDDYDSTTGSFAADHIITLAPAVYATYHLPEDRYPFSFGVGLDTASWYFVDWEPALFPGRFLNRHQELVLYDVHPVVAYEIGPSWNVGIGLHYYTGDLETGRNDTISVAGETRVFEVEVERTTAASVDGLGVDAGVQYSRDLWGWGLTFQTGIELEGTGEASYLARDVPPGLVATPELASRLETGSTRQRFELPWETRTGVWIAPVPEVELELDLVYQGWSRIDRTRLTVRPDPFTNRPRAVESTPRDWDDTVSVRLGGELRITPRWTAMAGIAYEPSPVPTETLEPGFPRGDSVVTGIGFTYSTGGIALDLGYSFHVFDDRRARGQEPRDPSVTGEYSSRNQVWAASARWAWR